MNDTDKKIETLSNIITKQDMELKEKDKRIADLEANMGLKIEALANNLRERAENAEAKVKELEAENDKLHKQVGQHCIDKGFDMAKIKELQDIADGVMVVTDQEWYDRAVAAEIKVKELEAVLQGIWQYACDTRSGRADGPQTVEWHREGWAVVRDRAKAATPPADADTAVITTEVDNG